MKKIDLAAEAYKVGAISREEFANIALVDGAISQDEYNQIFKEPKVATTGPTTPEERPAPIPAPAEPATIEAPKDQSKVGAAFIKGLSELNIGIMRIPAAAYSVASIPQNLLMKAVGRPDLQVKPPEILVDNPATKFYEKESAKYRLPELEADTIETIKRGDYAQAGKELALKFINNAPMQAGIIASAMTGAGAAGLIGMSAVAGGQKLKEAQQSGIDPAAVGIDVGSNAALEGLTESFGTFGLFKKWEKALVKEFGKKQAKDIFKAMGKTLAATSLGEANEETINSVAQDFSDFATGENPKALKGIGQRALNAGLVGGVSGFGMTAPGAMLSAAAKVQVKPDISPADIDRARKMAATDPVAALKAVSPVSEWSRIDTMAEQLVAQSEQTAAPEFDKQTLSAAALNQILENSIAPQPPAPPPPPAPTSTPIEAQDQEIQLKADVLKKTAELMDMSGDEMDALLPDKEAAMKVVTEVVAKGVSENKNVDQMAADLEAVLTPEKTPEPAVEELEKEAEIEAQAEEQPIEEDLSLPELDETDNPAFMTRERFKERFPEATPEQHAELVENAIRAGETLPDEVRKQYADIENKVMEEWEREATPELYQEGPSVFKQLRDAGIFIDPDSYRKHHGGDLRNLEGMGHVFRRQSKGGLPLDKVAGKMYELGIIPEHDLNMAIDKLNDAAYEQEFGKPTIQEEGTEYKPEEMSTDVLEEHILKRYEAKAPRAEINALETEYAKRISEEDIRMTEEDINLSEDTNGAGLEQQLTLGYHEYLKPEAERSGQMTDSDLIGNMRDAIETFTGGKSPKSDKSVLAAAKDVYENSVKLRLRYKKPKTPFLSHTTKINFTIPQQPAWHGSPYDFSKFTLDHIGTGEGAQVYGWGLYFAGKREVAEYYRDTTTAVPYQYKLFGKDVAKWYEIAPQTDTEWAEVLERILMHEHIDELKSFFTKSNGYSNTTIKKVQKLKATDIKAYDEEGNEISQGKIYQVDIPEDDVLLDWDKPLNEQPDILKMLRVKEAQDLLKKADIGFKELKTQGAELYHKIGRYLAPDPGTMGPWNEGNKAASKALNSLGIKGIKYLDQMSRDKGNYKVKLFTDKGEYTTTDEFKTREQALEYMKEKEAAGFTTRLIEAGTHNYVIFDEKSINILSKLESSTTPYSPDDLFNKTYQPELFTKTEEEASGVTNDTLPEVAKEIKENVKPIGPWHDLRLDKAIERIEKMWKESGLASFVGTVVDTIQDVAEMAAVYRHPKIEHLLVIYVKNNKIVGSKHYTSGNLTFVDVASIDFKNFVNEGIRVYGADGFYVSHNHPSADPTPSGINQRSKRVGDIGFTKAIHFHFGDTFKGGIVVNHEKFAVISPEGRKVNFQQYKTTKEQYRDLKKYYVSEAAAFAKSTLQGGKLGILFLDANLHLLSFDQVEPNSNFNSYVNEKAALYGAVNVILTTGREGMAKLPKRAVLRGVYTEMVLLEDDGNYFSARLGHIPGWRVEWQKSNAGRLVNSIAKGRRTETDAFMEIPRESMSQFSKGQYHDLMRSGKIKVGMKVTLRAKLKNKLFKEGLEAGTTGQIISIDPTLGTMLVRIGGKLITARPQMFRETSFKFKGPEIIEGQPTKQTIEQQTGVRPVDKEVVSTEMKLLNAKLASEARAARAAAKQTRAEIMTQLRVRNASVDAIRREIVKFITESLPTAARGRYIALVGKSKTTTDLGKAVVRASEEAEKIRRRELIEDIKKVADRALSSAKVDVEYREAVRGLLKEIDLVKHRPDTILRLKAMRDYVERMRKTGRSQFIPDNISRQLEILTRRPVMDISEDQLEVIYRDLLIIEAVGREAQEQKEMAWEMEKNAWLRDLLNNIVPPVNITQEGNMLRKRWEQAQEHYWSLSPIAILFDRFDGGNATYDGGHFKMYQVLSDDFHGFLNLKRQYVEPVLDLVDKYNLNSDSMDRIGIYAFKVQAGGTDRVLATLPDLTREYVENLTLTPEEMAVYNKMRESMESIFPEVKRIMGKLYNKDVGTVENYFSYITDWNKLTEMEVLERMALSLDNFSGARKSITRGFTKARLPNAISPVKINALKVFIQHMNDACYFISLQEDIKKFAEIIEDDIYRQTGSYKHVKLYLDLLARQGRTLGARKLAWLDTLRKNVGSATLGYKLTTILVQATSFCDAASYLGGGNVLSAWIEMTGNKPLQKWLSANFPKLRERIGDDLSFIDVSESKYLHWIQQKGYGPMKWVDQLVATATTLAAYKKKAGEMGIKVDYSKPADLKAVDFAELALGKTQASPFFIDMGLMFNSGNYGLKNESINKSLLQFMNFQINRWFYMTYDIPKMKMGERAAAYSWLAAGMALETGLRGMSRGMILGALGTMGYGLAAGVTGADDDDDMWKNYAIAALQNIPFMSSLISAWRYGSVPVPVADTFLKLFVNGRDALTAQNEYKKIRGLKKALIAISALGGLPGTQQAAQLISWASNPKTLTFPYNEEYHNLKELGINRTSDEMYRLHKLQMAKNRFDISAAQYRVAMKQGNIERATGAAKRAASALEGL